jgi:hypothetical protein
MSVSRTSLAIRKRLVKSNIYRLQNTVKYRFKKILPRYLGFSDIPAISVSTTE